MISHRIVAEAKLKIQKANADFFQYLRPESLLFLFL